MLWELMFEESGNRRVASHYMSQSNTCFFHTIIGKEDGPIRLATSYQQKKGGWFHIYTANPTCVVFLCVGFFIPLMLVGTSSALLGY